MIDLNLVAKAIETHGHSKVSSQVRLNNGETIPDNWASVHSVASTFGAKVASNRIARRNILAGLFALESLKELDK